MDKPPNNSSSQPDIACLKYKPTQELIGELKLLARLGSTVHSKIELILGELQLRGQNTYAAALIESIDHQRKKMAEDTAEMTALLCKREKQMKSALQARREKVDAIAKRTEELMEKQNQFRREVTKSRLENTRQ